MEWGRPPRVRPGRGDGEGQCTPSTGYVRLPSFRYHNVGTEPFRTTEPGVFTVTKSEDVRSFTLVQWWCQTTQPVLSQRREKYGWQPTQGLRPGNRSFLLQCTCWPSTRSTSSKWLIVLSSRLSSGFRPSRIPIRNEWNSGRLRPQKYPSFTSFTHD